MGNCISSLFDFFHSSFLSMGNSSISIPPRHQEEPENAFGGILAQASPSSSALTKKGPCDVFINHRGCDVKHKLASTIYHTLDLLGLRAFLDVENLELGDSIPQEIQEAMRTAGLHIAIFSERYAESPWCLGELSYMLKTGTPILPVFYHVKPDDLRWMAQGKGCYAPAFSQHEKKGRYSSNMLEEWKSALQKVSYLSGYMLNSHNDDEGKLLKSIVNSVLGTMKKVPLEVAKYPVAMDRIEKDFGRSLGKSIQSEEHVQIVGIVGFGGSGKTTLATELYNRKSSSFNRSSFVHDVRDAASKNALHTKQSKLLQDLRIQTASFDNMREGKAFVADRLKSLSVLIVLDDVDHEDQLDALLPPKESLGSGSFVIVTTREEDVLTKWGITSIYKMKPLHHFHAKQLFCWHAFLQPSPQEGFDELVEFFSDVCSGLPLSLKVIGGQLYGRKSMEYWYAQLQKIQRTLPKDIKAILKVSYDALERDEQNVFLDISCFFIGEERRLAIPVWDGSGWNGLCSLETLLNKCLVEVDKGGCIRMHDCLRDLGRDIATTSSPSRFWFQRQSVDIQRELPIRGIIAATAVSWGGCNRLDCPTRFKEYMEMLRISNLRAGLQLLVVGKNDFTEEYGELSKSLLWLRWFEFEHRYIPSWLSLENIRVLELLEPWHLETLWEDTHPPLELRELLIRKASAFQSFPQSIGHLKHLKRLSLDCGHWSSGPLSLPEDFCQLHWLEYLVLRGCDKLSCLPNCFGDLVNLRHLDLSFTSLEVLPVSFRLLIHLEHLNLSGCKQLTLDSNILENITNLTVFNVSFCEKLEVLPYNITNQASLEELLLIETSSLRELPGSIGQLSNLKKLIIVGCRFLTGLPSSLGNLSKLVTLKLESCPELHEMPSLAGLVSLNNLHVENCNKIKKIEGLEHLTSLEQLHVWTCWMVPGIHSLVGTEGLLILDLKAHNISAFEACIQSIQIGSWPWRMTICARIFPHVQSILDSFSIPGLTGDNSMKKSENLAYRQYSLTCRETNLSSAAIVCFLVRSFEGSCYLLLNEGQYAVGYSNLNINHKLSTRVVLSEGEWLVISVLREVSPVIKEEGRFVQASIDLSKRILFDDDDGDDDEDVILDAILHQNEVYGGRLIVGEKGTIVQGFKQFFQTLCKVASMS